MARFVPEEQKDAEAHLLFETAAEGLRAAASADARIIWARALINAAVVPADVALAARIADGEERIDGFEMDQQMRWDLAAKYIAYGMPGAAARVAAEEGRDPSDRGQRSKLRCTTSAPDPAVKAEAWERFGGEGYGSLKLTTAAMGGFNWAKQRDLLEPYVERFFAEVPGIFQAKDKAYFSDYFESLFPGYRVERDVLGRSQRLLAEAGEADPSLARMLREANDELERAIRCREYAARR